MRKSTKFDDQIIVIPSRRQCAKPYRLPLVSDNGSIEEDYTPADGKKNFDTCKTTPPPIQFTPALVPFFIDSYVRTSLFLCYSEEMS